MILDKDGRALRRVIGFNGGELERDASEQSVQASTHKRTGSVGAWYPRGGGGCWHQEPVAHTTGGRE